MTPGHSTNLYSSALLLLWHTSPDISLNTKANNKDCMWNIIASGTLTAKANVFTERLERHVLTNLMLARLFSSSFSKRETVKCQAKMQSKWCSRRKVSDRIPASAVSTPRRGRDPRRGLLPGTLSAQRGSPLPLDQPYCCHCYCWRLQSETPCRPPTEGRAPGAELSPETPSVN